MTVPTSLPPPGTFSFSPSASDLVLYAFSLCNIRSTELQAQHYIDASMAANMAMVNLSNHIPLRFAIETQTGTLTQGSPLYSLQPNTIAVPIVTISTTSGGSTVERVLGPISAYEYQALPTKAQQGPPTSYFFSLLSTPTLTFWPTPDGNGPYTVYVQAFRQLQDVDLTNMRGVDSPYRFLDTLATDIAARLAESYAPQKAPGLYALAEKRLAIATARDQETTPLTIMPTLSSYYRTY